MSPLSSGIVPASGLLVTDKNGFDGRVAHHATASAAYNRARAFTTREDLGHKLGLSALKPAFDS